MDQKKTPNTLGLKKTFQDKLDDILSNTPILTLNNLALFGRKYSLKLIVSIWSKILQVLFHKLEEIFKKTC